MTSSNKGKTAWMKNKEKAEEVEEAEEVSVELNREEEPESSSDDQEEESDFDEYDIENVNLPEMLQTFFASEDGVNVVDTLVSIKKSIDMQNKILMKLCSTLEKHVLNIK